MYTSVARTIMQGFIWRVGSTGIPTPEVDFPSLEFLKYTCTQRMVLEYWNMSDFPLLKNQQVIILY